jgi:hypothetical protein
LVGTIKVPIFNLNKKVMRTLVIHPHDVSTHFLKPIYENIPNKTIITGGLFTDEVNKLICSHDQIIMLGHGSSRGLFGVNFKRNYVISEDQADLLQDKECIFIWCHADRFVNEHNLKGLYSGMFVSEVGEALLYQLKGDKKLIDESNNTFAFMLGSVINSSLNKVYTQVKKDYGWLAERNEIAKYNHERIGLAE